MQRGRGSDMHAAVGSTQGALVMGAVTSAAATLEPAA
jgi:preprotein translocase subunit SecG